jgi:hypothetical protein
MAKNEKRVQVTLACEVCKRRNYITTKNKLNHRDEEVLPVGSPAHGAQGDPLSDARPAGATLGRLFPRSGE